MYAKFIDENTIEEAPVNKGGVFNYNLDIVAMEQDGYVPLIYTNTTEGLLFPVLKYKEKDGQIEACFEEGHILSYSEKRVAEYPPMGEYLDAQVKINSGDPELAAEGELQKAKYVADCLVVKTKYSK